MLRCVLVLFFVGSISGNQRYEKRAAVADYSYQTSAQSSGEGLASYSDFAEAKPQAVSKPEIHENVKTFIVTKRVPVPYTVHVEKKVPFAVKVPIRRPYAVYVPKPYLVEVTKQVPYPLRVPYPQPYTVEKHIPFPYKISVDKPYPLHISKPYPVFVEKKVPVPIDKHIPFQVKVPVDRPFPVHIPVEKAVSYTVEKPLSYPVKIPAERPVQMEKPLTQQQTATYYLEKPLKQSEVEEAGYTIQQHQQDLSHVKSIPNFTPSTYDPLTSSLITQGKQKVISFLPGSHDSYSTHGAPDLGTIHVSGFKSYTTENSTNDWIPKQQYTTAGKQSVTYVPQNVPNHYKFILPENKGTSTYANVASVSKVTPAPQKEGYTVQYDPKMQEYKFHFEPKKQEYIQYETKNHEHSHSTPLYEVKAPDFKNQQIHSQEEISQSFQSVTEGKKEKLKGNYQFYNIHPQKESSIKGSGLSYQRYENSGDGEGLQTVRMNNDYPGRVHYVSPKFQTQPSNVQYEQTQKSNVQYEQTQPTVHTVQYEQTVPTHIQYEQQPSNVQYEQTQTPNLQFEQMPQHSHQSPVLQQTLPDNYFEEHQPQASQNHASYEQVVYSNAKQYIPSESFKGKEDQFSNVEYQTMSSYPPQITYYKTVQIQPGQDGQEIAYQPNQPIYQSTEPIFTGYQELQSSPVDYKLQNHQIEQQHQQFEQQSQQTNSHAGANDQIVSSQTTTQSVPQLQTAPTVTTTEKPKEDATESLQLPNSANSRSTDSTVTYADIRATPKKSRRRPLRRRQHDERSTSNQ